MTSLDRVLPTAALVQVDTVTIGLDPQAAWDRLRHGNLMDSPATRGLFSIRTLPDRLRGRAVDDVITRVDDFASSAEHPGFHLLIDEPPREFVVGAIGKVWQPRIPFLHVADVDAFAAFNDPGYIKVAWAVRVTPASVGSHIAVEVRVAATDVASWTRFRRYFAFVGPFSRYIRHSMLRQLARDNPTA